MKDRSFLISLAATLACLLVIAFGVNWAMARESPLRLKAEPLHLPRSAQFVPREATLSLHWMIDPNRIPAYAEAVAPSRKRKKAREGAIQIRNGAFALAGLDFQNEISDWVGDLVSFSLLEPEGPDGPMGWVMALNSKDEEGAKRFLQRFWQTRTLAGTELQINSYRGIGLISGKNPLQGSITKPLATALIDDDLVLLASNKGVLEQALDSSQLSQQNQLEDIELQSTIPLLGEGIALLTASPSAMNSWLGIPTVITNRKDIGRLIASFKPAGRNLLLEGLLQFKEPMSQVSLASQEGSALLEQAGGEAQAIALITDPAKLLAENNQDPISEWLRPILKTYLNQPREYAAETIAKLDNGPFLWLQEPAGWVISTSSKQPEVDLVDEVLSKANLIKSSVNTENQSYQVWSKLVTKRTRKNDTVDTQLAVVLNEKENQNWWGETLASLQERSQTYSLQSEIEQLQSLANQTGEPLAQKVLLGPTFGEEQLNNWKPWQLLKTVAGKSLKPSFKGLAIGVGPDQDQNNSLLRLKARINMG